jgi:hypothetical protein
VTDPEGPPVMSLGGRLAGKIAETVVRASLSAKAQSGGHTAGVAQTVLRDFTNHVSDEIKSTMGPLWQKFAQDESTPAELRPTFQALATETGQAWGFIGGLATSTVLGGGLMDIIINEMNPLTHKLISLNPHGVLTISDAAAATVKGLNAGVDLDFDMAAQGLDDHRRQVVKNLAEASLPPGEINELMRRAIISTQEGSELLERLGFRPVDIARMLPLRHIPLSPADAAAAWARSSLTEKQTDEYGIKGGVSAEDMKILRDLAGQPPSPEELLFAWRRGVIKEGDVDRGLIQGPIRNEWLPVIKALQWQPLPVVEAANAVNQGHLTYEQAKRIATENGYKEADFKVIVDNAGRPPGPQEALDWVNRGYITEDQFRTIFLESTIKNKYIDLYLQSRFQEMPPETIRLMVNRGALTKEQGLERLQTRGYRPEDAAIIIDGASSEKTEKGRDLTVTQVLELRADGLITDDDALAMLEAAGYETDEALWITQLADLRRVSTYVKAAVNRTKASYIAGRIDETVAGGVLDQLGLPGDFKDSAFALWDLERSTVTKGLTTAQIVAAIKKGFMTQDDGMRRLEGQGYAAEDAQILLLIGGAITN